MILPRKFYLQQEVVRIARQLLGKVLVTQCPEGLTSGIICETEAYAGVGDKASHAYGGRRTARTETMYLHGGHAYVYLCYGIHELFNVVTHAAGTPHAVLVRGIIPLDGLDLINLRRRGVKRNIGTGPGNVSSCLGISRRFNGTDLCTQKNVWIEDRGIYVPDDEVQISGRIGVGYAAEDALLPYRFYWKKGQ